MGFDRGPEMRASFGMLVQDGTGLETGEKIYTSVLRESSRVLHDTEFRGRLGFDVGSEAAQGMPRRLFLVNPLAKPQTPTTSVSLWPLKA